MAPQGVQPEGEQLRQIMSGLPFAQIRTIREIHKRCTVTQPTYLHNYPRNCGNPSSIAPDSSVNFGHQRTFNKYCTIMQQADLQDYARGERNGHLHGTVHRGFMNASVSRPARAWGKPPLPVSEGGDTQSQRGLLYSAPTVRIRA